MANPKYHYNNAFFKNPMPCGGYLLMQAGEMYCDQSTVIHPHEQNCFEISYVVDGKGKASANGVFRDLEKNDCYLSISGDVHSLSSDKDMPLRFKFLAFSTTSDETQDYVRHINQYLTDSQRKVNVPELDKRFIRIFNELENGHVFADQAIAMEISCILIDIIRAMEKKTQKKYPVKINGDNILVFHIANYIDNNLLEIKNLYQLEDEFNYSYNYMSAVFKKIMNISINDYFIQAKMKTAYKMLSEEGLTVTEVSEKLNYSSVHTFSRSFKQHFGSSANLIKNNKKD
ncbi:MAG: helix-turn-helix transcriptional regulator [Clostridia bacterium]|nr:helix-turn-helix transcriptional regulator [Clostridia bacterium]